MKKPTAHYQNHSCAYAQSSYRFAARLSRVTTPLQTTKVGEHLTATWDDLYKILTVTGHSELSRKLWMSEKSNRCGWAKKVIFQPTEGKKAAFFGYNGFA